jgi:hypothetical protein
MRSNKLESSGLGKPYQLVVDKTILDNVQFLDVIVVCYESIKRDLKNVIYDRLLFVYYESIKRKLKTKYICGCRCYERLQPNTKEFECLAYTELVKKRLRPE